MFHSRHHQDTWSARIRRRPSLEVIEHRIAPAAIVGSVFIDGNGNGIRDFVETGHPGVRVFIDLNNDGKFNPGTPGTSGEPNTLTSQEGKYTLQAGPGTYNIRQVVPPNFMQTTPIPPATIVGNATVVEGPVFGNQPGSPPPPVGGTIHGRVFVDVDGDGTMDSNEIGQPNVRVFLDLNGDGKWSNVPGPIALMEPSALTGPNGGYEVKALADGEFQVLEVVPPGYVMTTPIPGKTAVSGGALVTGPDFGNKLAEPPPQQGGNIHGVVFVDLNGNALRENNEPGQPGVRVFIDLNNNGKFDPANTGTVGDPSVLSGPDGKYQIKVGIDGEYQLLEVVPPGFVMTTPIPGKVAVSKGATVAGPDFGNKLADPPVLQGGTIRGAVFVDTNGNGLRENTELGQPGVIVFIDANGNGKFDPGPTPTNPGEQFTISGPNGHYEVKVAKDGEYSVLEVVPQGFKMTTPPPGKVAVAGGAIVTGPEFGNQPLVTIELGSVRGRVFYDANANAKLDPNEPGMPGVRIYDDANNNSKFDAGERFTFSGFKGNYLLRLTPGEHNVRQVVPQFFVQTVAPGPITIVAGQVVNDAHFGNKLVFGGGGGPAPIWGFSPPTGAYGFSAGGVVVDDNSSSNTNIPAPVFNAVFVGMP